jgi:hypothetical protein
MPDIVKTFSIGAVPRDGTDAPSIQKVNLSHPPKEKTLLELCVDSLANNTPPADTSDGAKAVHERWLQWLASAFGTGVYAKDIEGAIATLNAVNDQGHHLTTCTCVMYVCLRHFGIPAKKYVSGQTGPTNIVPASWDQPYRRVITKTTLPRPGDPIFIGGVDNKPAHHAFFGNVVSTGDSPVVTNYAGGQATVSNYHTTIDAKPYPCHLKQDDKGTKIYVGDRQLRWFTDMWSFFKDHHSEIANPPPKPGLA